MLYWAKCYFLCHTELNKHCKTCAWKSWACLQVFNCVCLPLTMPASLSSSPSPLFFISSYWFIKSPPFSQGIYTISSCWCHSKTSSVSLLLAFELFSREISWWFTRLILAHQKLRLIKISLHWRQYFWNLILISIHFDSWEGKRPRMAVPIFILMENCLFLAFFSLQFLLSKKPNTLGETWQKNP